MPTPYPDTPRSNGDAPSTTRADRLRIMKPHLLADVKLYRTEDGGRAFPAPPGWGCLCVQSAAVPVHGYDARLQLGDEPLHPGETRRIGFVFLYPDTSELLRSAGRFLLRESRVIGEATVID